MPGKLLVSAVPKQLVQALFGTLGLRLMRLGAFDESLKAFGETLKANLVSSSLDTFFSTLKERGFAPKHIIDVGANHGHWTRAALKYFPQAYYTLVEPQDHLRSHVQDLLTGDGRVRWIGAGASDNLGTLPLCIPPHRDDSSSFVFTTSHLGCLRKIAGMSQIEVPVTTLNEIVRTSDAPFPDLVKIDAEGFDLKVLAGASRLVGKTDIFLLEATICARGLENTLENVIQTMAHLGYRIFDITDRNYSSKYGVLWLCELAFLRNGSHLLDGIDSYD